MKKLLGILVIVAVLSMVVVPVVFATHTTGHVVEILPIQSEFPTTGPKSAEAVLLIMGNIGNWLFAIFMGIALIFIVMGALQFVTGGGDPAKVSEARQKMIWAAVGIGFALLAAFFDDIIASIVNV